MFDNVVEPDATEDVVGLSKKMLQTLIDDLASGAPADDAAKVETAEALVIPKWKRNHLVGLPSMSRWNT
ncbi:hypothetical protein [Methylomonas albis]|uniref:Uncharacterized protein n=1 Tax=Methylomonas albis TaxID=1854563 RepID=A0ABR9CWD4_9GAMM|nr:hypothetical protein [Methylomonas albis]MBD9355172.1 hypothetical protein [Methylomonas albis]